MVDHQHFLPGTGHIAQAPEPVDARNINGHNQINITTHDIGVDQKPTAGQRL